MFSSTGSDLSPLIAPYFLNELATTGNRFYKFFYDRKLISPLRKLIEASFNIESYNASFYISITWNRVASVSSPSLVGTKYNSMR